MLSSPPCKSSSQSHSIATDEEEIPREIRCPVHEYIRVSNLITSIIDTPQFQRLRFLKQLGTSYYIWPGAAHNRFEHSLGVYHLASVMVNRLSTAQPSLNISKRDIKCVEVAGLCHDLGHGPFSHVWDSNFVPTAVPGSTWKHEDASQMMFDYLVEDNNIDLTPEDVAFIKDLIAGSTIHSIHHDPPEKPFLFEIVANKRNGIDVDKFDYILRDTRALSGGSNTDLMRLIKSARVIDGEICYSEKNATTVYSLCQERFMLHKKFYQHKTSKCIEYMIVDALLLADPYLKISQRIRDPRKFMYLNDDILNEVERSEVPELEKARKLIHRIRKRELYRMIDKGYFPWASYSLWRENFTPARIVEMAQSRDDLKALASGLREDHIIVDLATLHHGMGDKFPLDSCKFYGKYNMNEAFPPRRSEDISHLLPQSFGEVCIRVFTRDRQYHGVIQAAARALSETISQPEPSGTARLSKTPEAPTTPRAATSSMSSLGDAPPDSSSPVETSVLQTPHSESTASKMHVTPFYNKFTTVSPDFTPKSPTDRASSRKRRTDDDEDPLSMGSPTKRTKKKKNF